MKHTVLFGGCGCKRSLMLQHENNKKDTLERWRANMETHTHTECALVIVVVALLSSDIDRASRQIFLGAPAASLMETSRRQPGGASKGSPWPNEEGRTQNAQDSTGCRRDRLRGDSACRRCSCLLTPQAL